MHATAALNARLGTAAAFETSYHEFLQKRCRLAANQRDKFTSLVHELRIPVSEIGFNMSERQCADPTFAYSERLAALVDLAACDDAARLFFQMDQPMRLGACHRGKHHHNDMPVLPPLRGSSPDASASSWPKHKHHNHLEALGYLLVDDWNLDMDALSAQAAAALSSFSHSFGSSSLPAVHSIPMAPLPAHTTPRATHRKL